MSMAAMLSSKRKVETDDSATKRTKKRRRSDQAESAGDLKFKPLSETENKESDSRNKKTHSVSVLAKEQPAFPRGGAGLLTPLERKQIHAKASRDAAKEYSKSQDLFGANDPEDDSSSNEDVIPKTKPPASQESSRKLKKKKARLEIDDKERATQIGGLSYKRITVGSLILGQVTAISSRDLTVALPNNLTGYVPITSVSKQFSEKIQRVLDEGNNSDEEAAEAEDKDNKVDLDSYFNVGQHIRVAVTSTGDDGAVNKTHSRRRLELSTEPSRVNVGLSNNSLAVGCTVQAAVSSIEDHGLVVDLGIEDESVKGFVPVKALPGGKVLSNFCIGAVFLCQVVSLGSNGKTVKLSADLSKAIILKSAPSMESFLPGTLTEILITQVQENGLAGKIMGLIETTSDLVHSGSYKDREAFLTKFKIGKKIQGRLICNFPLSDDKRLGFSILDNITTLSPEIESASDAANKAISSIIPSASIIRVEPGLGVYLDIGETRTGFAHISRLADKKVDSISEITGPYKLGSQHKARIIDFNPIDNLYLVSLQQKTLEQPFLRIEDVHVGKVVKVQIDKLLIGPAGIKGLIVDLAEGVTGLVPDIHLSDVVLQHPEKKFREGHYVTARVLSTDPAKRQIRLTLKKTLVNSDAKIWSKFEDINVGDSSVGTLVKVDPHGALVQFYGSVRGFLPVAEMSEAYIKDAREHFRVGQVVSVNAISVNPEAERLTVSCRDNNHTYASTESILSSLQPGSLASGTVFEKSQDDVLLRLEGSDVIARLTLDHVSDGSLRKRQSALSKIRVGQRLENLLILDVQAKRRLVLMCNRSSLIKASQEGKFLSSFEALETGKVVTGFVSNITTDGIFVSFAARISGLITKRNVPVDAEQEADFGVKKLQPITAKVVSVDYKGATPRFWLTMREIVANEIPTRAAAKDILTELADLTEPVDPTLRNESDLWVNRVTKARIVSVKDTQLNVELAKDVQGRVDVSEVFDAWNDIKDRKKPLRHFNPRQILSVKVLGAHDTRNHRFLPLTHRTGKTTVYELTAKPSSVGEDKVESITLKDMKVSSSWSGFVNNVAEGCLWVNISPSIRGRIRAVDASDDLSLAADLEGNFPVGSALRVRVLAVDEQKGRLDLTARSGTISDSLTMKDISEGLIIPGRITKVSERQILVQLSDGLVGAVDLIDLADDYTDADPAKHHKNEIVRVCVVRVDAPNKKICLSLRPSKVLSSSMKVVDPEVTNISQLEINGIYRGFIRNVDDKGIFVSLGQSVTAFVRVAHLSDAYLKEWKDQFQRDQLVTGKIISIDKASGHIQMSLKESVLKSDYKPPLTFNNLKVGDIVTGKVAKVETFGVFIVVDNSENVRGLCHRSEIAEKRVEDASKLFSEGDVVKAKVLKIDASNRRVNFGMKALYFSSSTADDDEGEDEDGMDNEGSEIASGDEFDESAEGGAALSDEIGKFSDDEDDEDSRSEDPSDGLDEASEDSEQDLVPAEAESKGLKVGGFDWTGISDLSTNRKRTGTRSDADEATDKSKKRKKRAEIQVDRTGDLDANGPQSVDDYERLLLGEPDSSLLWLQYMAFHLELGDVDHARQIGERALKSIGLGQEADKMNVWVALLNLENAYGDDETIESTFKQACEFNDSQEIHSRLTSIFIHSGKQEKADDMFQRMLKRFTQDPKVWLNYATFLFDKAGNADKARDLLPRALQTLPKFTHLDVTLKFAQLEFKCTTGLAERGRTIFEGLISSFPKRIDLYNVLLDLEMKVDDKERVRGVFERIFSSKLKPKQAKYFFKRWLAFEEQEGDERKIEEVKARAATWIRTAGTRDTAA